MKNLISLRLICLPILLELSDLLSLSRLYHDENDVLSVIATIEHLFARVKSGLLKNFQSTRNLEEIFFYKLPKKKTKVRLKE